MTESRRDMPLGGAGRFDTAGGFAAAEARRIIHRFNLLQGKGLGGYR